MFYKLARCSKRKRSKDFRFRATTRNNQQAYSNKMTLTKDSVFDQLEDYTRNMTKEDILKSFISFLPQSQIEELKDSLDRDYF